MKNKLLYVILVVAAFIGVQGFATEVTNVELSYSNGSTVAKINVDGTVRFTHQTEEAKDGKPFRVIVDVLSATHELGAKNFMRLPQCSIEGLRTSQYSTSPEKIVRLVFDMKKETFYSIDSDEHSISVTVPDKSCQPFTAWSSRSVVNAMKAETKETPPAVAVAETPSSTPVRTTEAMNRSIEKDRQESLAPSSQKIAGIAPTKPETKPVQTVDQQRLPSTYNTRDTYGPVYDRELALSTEPVDSKPVPQSGTDKVSPEVKKVSSVPAKAEEVKAETKTEPIVTPQPTSSQPETKPAVKQNTPPVQPEVNKKPVMAKAESSPNTAASTKPVEKKTVKQESKPSASGNETEIATTKPKAKQTESAKVTSKPQTEQTESVKVVSQSTQDSQSSTSRFRRSAVSRKVKGTLVAEFPKRLVIKYKSGSTRDPFETLVNDTRVNNSMIERSVPNVEGLKLVGVIESNDGDNRALFEDNSGYGYILKSGDKVRKGYVLRVESNRVYFQIFEYGWSRTVALNLEEN